MPSRPDPEGLIQQPYLQIEKSGGFLLVEVTPAEGEVPAKLIFQLLDEHGELHYKHVKEGRK
jgi:hypothetical protein